uniref:Pentacotripeptide-repeat region of PRORP domain-containing protein n=1 Tax=Rhodosorus marinus TaxID=101924 RepID=A0A7S3EAN1_9RHOD|mmetsp:Transcript_21088/g.86089  ORF Transcript_21088/g.86089 Transcript_21088/m.86089 type:complete len:660 (+) Transcript_21088:292-2271(+)
MLLKSAGSLFRGIFHEERIVRAHFTRGCSDWGTNRQDSDRLSTRRRSEGSAVNARKTAETWQLVVSGKCDIANYHFLLRYATPERTLDIVKLMLERNVPVGDGWLLTLQKKFQGSEFSKRILNLFELHCIAANRDEDDHMSETLLFFYLTFRKFDKARALFEQLCASGTASRYSFQIMMKSYANMGNMDQVIKIHDKMLAAGFEASRTTAPTLLSAVSRSGDLQKAEELFHASLSNLDDRGQGRLVTAMIESYNYHGNYPAAISLYKRTIEEGQPVLANTFNVVLKSYSRMQDVDGARKALNTMRSFGYEPKLRAYNELLLCYGDASFTSEALELFDLLREFGPEPDFYTYAMIIKIQGEAGKVQEANKLFLDMMSVGILPNLVVYSTMIKMYCQNFDMVKAEEMFKMMLDDNIKADASVFNIMIEGYCKNKQMSRAEDVVFEMLRSGLKPRENTLSELVRGYVLLGLHDRAEMLTRAVRGKGMELQDRDYGKLIISYARRGQRSKVEGTVRKLLEKGHAMTTRLCNDLIMAYILCNDLEKALTVFESMKKRGSRNCPARLVCRTIADRCSDSGLCAGVVCDPWTYTGLIDGVVRRHGYNCEKAADLFTEWKGKQFAETWEDGTVFVNLVPYSVCSALTAVWYGTPLLEKYSNVNVSWF